MGLGVRPAAWAVAALAVAVGAAYPAALAHRLGAPVPVEAVGQGALRSLAPAVAVLLVARLARGHRAAGWTALGGGLLVVALGAALYAAALSSESVRAPFVAVRLVPLRQLAAAAVAGWAVWWVRRTS